MNSNGMAFWLSAALLMSPLALSAQQGSIYSWTDENGVKHFSDRAPVENPADVEQIPMAAEPPPASDAPDTLNNEVMTSDMAVQATDAPGEELSYADQQRLAMEERRRVQREKQADRQRICLQATDQLARIEPSRRVFYTDEAGNTTRMDDEERVQIVETNKALVAEYCD